jgi:hypothetical protein
MKVEINNLHTVKNYAGKHNFSTSYIYKLIRENKLKSVEIDGVQFIDIKKNPEITKGK